MKLELTEAELNVLLILIRKNPHETADPVLQFLSRLIREKQLISKEGASDNA